MVLKAKTSFYDLKKGKYAIYIPKALLNDSQWPFKDMKAPIEIVIMPSKVEGLGKLLIRAIDEGKPRG